MKNQEEVYSGTGVPPIEQYTQISAKQPWKPRVSGLIGLFCGPIAAGIVTYINLNRLGQPRKAKRTLGVTLLGSVILVIVLWFMPIEAALLPLRQPEFKSSEDTDQMS